MKSGRTLGKFFADANGDLAILITRTRQLSRWTAMMRNQLDDALAIHCYIGALDDSTLTIFVDDAAWATRLRFQSAQLIPRLREVGSVFSDVQRIAVKILNVDRAAEATRQETSGPALSTDNANIINSLSDSIDDPELQEALQRLARHAAPK